MENLKNHKLKKLSILAALSGMLAVIIGAFGAHALVEKIPAASLTSYKTGVSYQFYHTIAAIVAIGLYQSNQSKFFRWAAICFLIGIVLFSGSIYLLTTRALSNISFTNIQGPSHL